MTSADLSNPTEPVRLYHLAKEWEIPPAVLVDLLRSGGLEVGSHFTEVRRDAIQELKSTLARGRDALARAKESARAQAKAEAIAEAEAKANAKAEAEASAKADAEAEAIAKTEVSAKTEESAKAEDAPAVESSTDEPGTVDGAPKKKRRRRRNKKRKTGEAKRPTRSLYGSGRLTPTELVPTPAKAPSNNDGVAPSVPSFGKRAVAPPSEAKPAPAPGADPATAPQDPIAPDGASSSETPNEPLVPVEAPATEAPPRSAPGDGEEPSSTWKVLLVLSLLAIGIGAIVFALSTKGG